MKYQPEIDGLRAVAVIAVILFHAGFFFFSGGYVGVDVFFVISGYLITGILLRDIASGRFSIGYFYERRARRILPALYLVISISIPFAWFIMLPGEFSNFSMSIVSVSLFFSNIFFWESNGYFGPRLDENPFLHTWSLAVEEQFYIFFPLLLLLVYKWRKKILLWIILTFTVLSYLLMEFVMHHISTSGSAAFFLAPTRAWELLIGALCAMIVRTHPQKPNNLWAYLGFLFIVVAIFFYNEDTPFPSAYTLLPVIGTALIVLYGSIETVVGKLLSHKYLVGIGLISYSAYLWHQPLFVFAHLNNPTTLSTLQIVGLSIASFILAYYSWYFIEQPFRDKSKVSRQTIVTLSLAGILIFVIFGLHSRYYQGYEHLWLQNKSEVYKQTYQLTNKDPRTWNFGANESGVIDNDDCRFNVRKLGITERQRLDDCYVKYGPGIAVLGDSHATDLVGVILSSSDEKFVFGLTAGGCSAHDASKDCYLDHFVDYVKEKPEKFALLIYEEAAFRTLQIDGNMMRGAVVEALPLSDPFPETTIDTAGIAEIVVYLHKLEEHVPVIWFGPRIEPRIHRRVLLALSCKNAPTLRSRQVDQFQKLDEYLSIVSEEQNIEYISQNKRFRFNFPDDLMSCDYNYWADDNHLSATGEREFGSRFDLIEYAKVQGILK